MSATVMHRMTGSSSVRCGAPMKDGSQGWGADAPGWDLGTATTDLTKVTCPECLPKPPAPRGGWEVHKAGDGRSRHVVYHGRKLSEGTWLTAKPAGGGWAWAVRTRHGAAPGSGEPSRMIAAGSCSTWNQARRAAETAAITLDVLHGSKAKAEAAPTVEPLT